MKILYIKIISLLSVAAFTITTACYGYIPDDLNSQKPAQKTLRPTATGQADRRGIADSLAGDLALPEGQSKIASILARCKTAASKDTREGLALTMEAIRGLYSSNRYGKPVEIEETLSAKKYRELIDSLIGLSHRVKRDRAFLRELAAIGELLDMALLLSLVEDFKGDELWARLNTFFNCSLSLSEPVPAGRLLCKGAFADVFGAESVNQKLFTNSHAWLYGFLRELVIARTDVTASEFTDMTEIGLSLFPAPLRFLFEYTRLAEIASIVKGGFGRPTRFERELDTKKEGLLDKPVLAVHYRIGDMQMYLLRETKGRKDLTGIMSQFCDVCNDPATGEEIVVIRSGLFYDRDGNLTLAEFKAPLRVDYPAFPLKRDEKLKKVRDTGVPMPFPPELVPVSTDKQIYPDFFEGSDLPIPIQVTWSLQRTKGLGYTKAPRVVRGFLIDFAEKHGLESIFIKPAKGTGGVKVSPFKIFKDAKLQDIDEKILDQAVGHIVELGDDAIIQGAIPKLDFRSLIQESIELGHLKGRVNSVLGKIFGRPVEEGAKIDWVVRNIISRRDDGSPVVLARRIIVNDRGVANTGQGGVMIDINDYFPQLQDNIADFDSVNIRAVGFAADYGKRHHADVTSPLDGASAHESDITLIDNIVTPEKTAVIIEIDFGFVSNMWRADAKRSEWAQPALDRVAKRANAYRRRLADIASCQYPYDSQRVDAAIREHGKDIHNFTAQKAIFEPLQETYDAARDDEIIARRIRQARRRGEKVVVGIGGLGTAGIGPSILQAACQKITDMQAIRAKVNRFYAGHSKDMDQQIADCLWQLYVFSQQDSLSVAQIEGALNRMQEAEDMVGAVQSAANRAKLKGKARREAHTKLNRFLALVDNFREEVLELVNRAPKQNIFSVFAIQPLTSPPGHGYFVGLVNNSVFPHGINDGGLKAIIPQAHPMLYATASHKAVEHADTLIVTVRLDVEPTAPGKHQVEFGPLMKEIEDFARPLAVGIENAKKEGRKPPLVIIVTTQGPGTSRMLIDALEKGLRAVADKDYKCGEDFYFVHAPSNIDPGKNWVSSLTKAPQPIGGVNQASIDAGVEFFSAYNQAQKVYSGPQSLERVELYKVFRNVSRADDIANASIGSHAASLVGAEFPGVRAHIHDTADVGRVSTLGKVPSHHLPFAFSGVGGPCLYKEVEIIQALGLMGTDAFSHNPGPFSSFLLAVVNTSILTFMRASRQVNEMQPYYVAGLAFGALEKAGLPAEEAKVLLAGIAYKSDMGGDTRHTPAYDILMGLLADSLNLRGMPANFEAAYPYLSSHSIPEVFMIDPDVSYFREIDQRANMVPDIDSLADKDDQIIKRIPALASAARDFFIEHKAQLSSVKDIESLRAVAPGSDNDLIYYIADFFFLTERGKILRQAWKKLASSEIAHEPWKAVEGKDLLLLTQGHKPFKAWVEDLPRLAKVMRHKIIVDGVNFMDDEKIKEWQALGGIYLGIGKANPYIDFLQQTVDRQSQMATRLLEAKRRGDLAVITQTLDLIKEQMPLEELLNLRGPLQIRELALKLYQGITPADLTWEMWYYFGGGQYLLQGAEEAAIAETRQVFSSSPSGLVSVRQAGYSIPNLAVSMAIRAAA